MTPGKGVFKIHPYITRRSDSVCVKIPGATPLELTKLDSGGKESLGRRIAASREEKRRKKRKIFSLGKPRGGKSSYEQPDQRGLKIPSQKKSVAQETPSRCRIREGTRERTRSESCKEKIVLG